MPITEKEKNMKTKEHEQDIKFYRKKCDELQTLVIQLMRNSITTFYPMKEYIIKQQKIEKELYHYPFLECGRIPKRKD